MKIIITGGEYEQQVEELNKLLEEEGICMKSYSLSKSIEVLQDFKKIL